MLDVLREKIIQDFGLDILSKEDQEKALEALGRIVFQQVIMRINEELKPESLKELEKVSKESEENPQKIVNFLKEKIPNIEEIINEELNKIKDEFLKIKEVLTG